MGGDWRRGSRLESSLLTAHRRRRGEGLATSVSGFTGDTLEAAYSMNGFAAISGF